MHLKRSSGAVGRAAAFALAGAALVLSAAAQQSCETFGPLAPELHVSQAYAYDQFWVQTARGGNRIGFTWSAGQDIFARFYDTALQPVTDDLFVNTTLNFDNQDEPAIACNGAGRSLIAWSDRAGYDGQLMGIFARLYDASGAPLTGEFQVNVAGATSQWRPLIATTPAGGFVVAWTGDWDGDSFFRIYDGNASPLTGDVLVNVYEFDAQVDPAPAVAPDGTIFIAFIDYSSHGSVGSGINLYGRTFNAAGQPQQSVEFPITSWTSDGDQREPRVAADGLGRFIVVWEDALHDGSGYGLFARRYDTNLNALEPEFQVNATTSGDQRAAALAADFAGNWTLAYEDKSQGASRILARRFDANAAPLGNEVQINAEPASGTVRTTIASAPGGGVAVFAYEGPGDGLDIFARPFFASDGPQVYCAAKLNSQNCWPSIGWSGIPSASTAVPFQIHASNVINQKSGLLIYALDSRFLPFQGGTLCVGSPFHRTPGQSSGGNPTGSDCSGHLTFDFNAWFQSGIDPSLAAGVTVSAQYYYRDPQDLAGFGSGLTNALRFAICP